MELRHIRYFARAAELLHFTHAAESLHISQPTLSTHIQQLEEELGLPVFDRMGRAVKLTEAGELFLQHAQRALIELEKAQDEIAELKGTVSGTLRLGSILTFGNELLPQWIASFRTEHPNIFINVQSGASDFIERELRSGNIDLGLAYATPADKQLCAKILFTHEIFLIVAKSHPWADRKTIPANELNGTPMVLVSRRWGVRRIVESFFEATETTPDLQVEIDDIRAMLEIVKNGNLAGLATSLVVAGQTDICTIAIEGPPMQVMYAMLWSNAGNLSPAARAFLEHISRYELMDGVISSGTK